MTVTPEQQRARTELKIEALRLMSKDLQAALARPIPERDSAIEALVEETGGRLQFTSGAYQLRLSIVTASATSGRVAAADNWLRAAARKMAALRETRA